MAAIGKPKKEEGPKRVIANPNGKPNPVAIPVAPKGYPVPNWPTKVPTPQKVK